jgi:AcrR family transcriptional regulator
MTYLVIMPTRLDFDELVAQLEAYATSPDGGDARARTRGRILRAAAPLFEQYGYRRTSIDDVAREAGIAKGTIYVHFKSKAELLFHAIVEEKKRLIERFRPVFGEQLAPKERLRRYLEVLLITVAESPLSQKLLTGDREILTCLEELPAELRAQIEGQSAEGMAALLGGVGALDALPAEDREERTRAFQGVLYSIGHLMDARVRAGLSVERYARQLARIIVDGVGAP